MARRKKGRKSAKKELTVYGPYKQGKRWRLVILDGCTSKRNCPSFASREEALELRRSVQKEAAIANGISLEEAVLEYRKYQTEKGNKLKSRVTTELRLLFFFENDRTLPVARITSKRVEKLYQRRREKVSAATHRGELSQVKTFLNFLVERGHLRANPAAKVKPIGKKNKGKKQLRTFEAKMFLTRALGLADEGDEGGFACATVLLLGLRSSEILRRVVRDVDPVTHELYVEDAKTEAGNRRVEIPDLLWPYFKKRIEGREQTEVLLPSWSHDGCRRRSWLRKRTKEICRDVGVPEICPHGLRGTHSSVAQAAGTSAHIVAQSLGHADIRTTIENYTAPGIVEEQRRKRSLKVLTGGRSGS